MNLSEIRVGQSVKVVKHCGETLPKGEVYTVAAIVTSGTDHHGACSGVILHDGYRNPVPFVWDARRFVSAPATPATLVEQALALLEVLREDMTEAQAAELDRIAAAVDALPS